VTVDGLSGYIRSDLISASGDTSGTTASTSETPADVTAVNPVSATVKGGQSVRVRSNASTTSQIVTTAASGTALTITGQATGTDGKVWYQVNFISNGSSVEGFIRNDFVDLTEELTPYTEEENSEEGEEAAEPETVEEPVEEKAYETVLQDGEWYLVVTETNEGYVIQDIFDKMESNQEAYAKLEKKAKNEKIVIVLLVLFLIAAGTGVILLSMKIKDMEDARYFNEVERETLRRRNAQGRQGAMPTVGTDRQAAKTAARPSGAGSQGARPAGQTVKANGARPAGARPGQTAKAAGTRPAGANSQGTRPSGANSQGSRPVSQGSGQKTARTAGQNNRQQAAAQTAKSGGSNGWQSKNFLADDDEEFEFEFLNYDGSEEQE
jgi:hypothetical protein